MTVWSLIVLREIEESESSDTVMKDILEIISKPPGSEELNGELSFPKPSFGMISGTMKSSCPKPKVADSRVYLYGEMIERRENLTPMRMSFMSLMSRKGYKYSYMKKNV